MLLTLDLLQNFHCQYVDLCVRLRRATDISYLLLLIVFSQGNCWYPQFYSASLNKYNSKGPEHQAVVIHLQWCKSLLLSRKGTAGELYIHAGASPASYCTHNFLNNLNTQDHYRERWSHHLTHNQSCFPCYRKLEKRTKQRTEKPRMDEAGHVLSCHS